jgi:Protein of unknown function (DUF3152)
VKWTGLVVALVTIGAMIVVAGCAAKPAGGRAGDRNVAGTAPSSTPDGEQNDNAEVPLPAAEPSSAAPSPTPTARSRTAKPTPTKPNPTKSTTPAQWTYASTGGPAAGTGRIFRYLVAAETSTGQDVNAFAAHVQSTLNNTQRGWIRSGRWGFQRVATAPADFTVWLATPATTDAICARYGINTEGKVSCRGGPNVVINLVRWRDGIEAYAGQVGQYQHLVINHEVGHFLGHLHVLCPGEGMPAPVMQTQFYGMKGCVPNVWPYAEDGTFVTGPPPP